MKPASPSLQLHSHCRILGMLLALWAGAVMADPPYVWPDTNNDSRITLAEYSRYAEADGLFANWDLNNDGVLSQEEWSGDYNYDYLSWDVNKDAVVDRQEFYRGTFNHFDENDDGVWDESEWDVAADAPLWDR